MERSVSWVMGDARWGADVFDTLEGVVSKAALPQLLGVISEYCLVGQHGLQKEFGFSE